MQNQQTSRRSLPLFAGALVLAVVLPAACDQADSPASPEASRAAESPGLSATPFAARDGLAEFRWATARYHRVEVALEDGFVPLLPCQENPAGEGALGIPYANLERFDDVIDLSEPEILFYEPQPDGGLRLVGGEPVVPIEMWTGSEPPSLFGLEFHKNEAHGLFGLHMWTWKPNPDGVFAFWHPEVTCEFAD